MITHVVFFKMLPEADNATAEENAYSLIALLNELPTKIPQLVDMQAGLDFSRGPASFDVALVSRFRNKEDLLIYRDHPEHQKVVELIGRITSDRAVVDFE